MEGAIGKGLLLLNRNALPDECLQEPEITGTGFSET
jgi:hypothetical protein